jgi:hypothetical protein
MMKNPGNSTSLSVLHMMAVNDDIYTAENIYQSNGVRHPDECASRTGALGSKRRLSPDRVLSFKRQGCKGKLVCDSQSVQRIGSISPGHNQTERRESCCRHVYSLGSVGYRVTSLRLHSETMQTPSCVTSYSECPS